MVDAVSLDELVRSASRCDDDKHPETQALGLAEQALAFSGPVQAPAQMRHRNSILSSLFASFRSRANTMERPASPVPLCSDEVIKTQTQSTPSLYWSPSLELEPAPDTKKSPLAHETTAASPTRDGGAALAGVVGEHRDIVLVWEFGAANSGTGGATVRPLLLERLTELRSTCVYLFAAMLFETKKHKKSVSDTLVVGDVCHSASAAVGEARAARENAGLLVMWNDEIARCVTPRGRECPFVSLPRVSGSDVLRFSRESSPSPLLSQEAGQAPWSGVHNPAIHLFVWNGTDSAKDVRLAAFAKAQALDDAFAIPSAVHAAVTWVYQNRCRPAPGGPQQQQQPQMDCLGAVVRAVLLESAQQMRPVSLGRKTTVITLVHERFSKIRQRHKSVPHNATHTRSDKPHEDGPLVSGAVPADEHGSVRRGRLSRSFTTRALHGPKSTLLETAAHSPESALLAGSPGGTESLSSSHRQTTSDRGEMAPHVPKSSTSNAAPDVPAIEVVPPSPTVSSTTCTATTSDNNDNSNSRDKEAEDSTGRCPVAGRVCLAGRTASVDGSAEHKTHRSGHRHHSHSHGHGHRRQASDTQPEASTSSSSSSSSSRKRVSRLSLNLSESRPPLPLLPLGAKAKVMSLSLPSSQRSSCAVLPEVDDDAGGSGDEGGGARLYRGVLSEVDDGLFVTGDEGASNLGELQRCGVTCIVNAADRVCREHFPGQFRYYSLDLLDDGAKEDLRPLFLEVIDIVEQQRARGGATVLHCQQGISRSATLAIAYAMWRHRLPFRAALDRVTKRRPVVSPNGGFMGQLLLWEAVLRSVWARAAGTRLLRVSPHAGSHHEILLVGKDVAVAARASLDPRCCFVLHDPADRAAYTWLGEHSCEAYRQGALKLAGQLQRLLGVASVPHELQGFESRDFWCALGDSPGPIACVASFDTDCGKLAPTAFHRFPAWDPVDTRTSRFAEEARCQAWASYRPLSPGDATASSASSESSACPAPATTAGAVTSPHPEKEPRGVALVWVPEHFVVRTPDGRELRDPARVLDVVFTAFVSAGSFPASTVCHHITTLDELARLQHGTATRPSSTHSSACE